MATANDILTVARAQLGTKETPAGSNKVKYNTAYYGRTVSGSAYPWCCAFVWWVFRQVNAALFYGGGKTAYDWGYVCRNYYALLHTWIARETDTDKLAGIDFGKALPDDLMQQLTTTLSGAGIDTSKYSGMFTT